MARTAIESLDIFLEELVIHKSFSAADKRDCVPADTYEQRQNQPGMTRELEK